MKPRSCPMWLAIAICSSGLISRVAADEAPSTVFRRVLAAAWENELRAAPLFATSTGDHRFNDQLGDVSPAALDRHALAEQQYLGQLLAIDRRQLNASEQIDHALFVRYLREQIAEHEFGFDRVPITNRDGFHIEFAELARNMPLRTEKDFENYIARLRDFPRFVDDHIALMREGIRTSRVLPSIALNDYRSIIEPQLVDDPTQSRLYAPLRELSQFSPEIQQRLQQAAQGAIREAVVPGYRTFLQFLQAEYVPACRDSIGVSALPQGREYYRHRVRKFTTLDVLPEQIHETGLAEVQRIRQEMQQVIDGLKFAGNFAAFIDHLRTDARFYPETPEQLMKEVGYTLKRMDGELPRLFKTLPRMPYGILPVPSYIAPQTTTAYYSPPAGDGSRAGFYFVNTYNLKSRPLYEVEALSLHEAVPGHHLQLALQQELTDLAPFRRFVHWTAFVEGWGLYAERLGLETGFYTDPYSNFGRLSYEMWRACRLVVDTGIHYFGWSRQQAIDYMAENTALSLHNITAEVDRYISWPGQAVAYKMGELDIRRLRKLAEDQLGKRFEIREFHDVVLGAGSVPLDVLGERVAAYIERSK